MPTTPGCCVALGDVLEHGDVLCLQLELVAGIEERRECGPETKSRDAGERAVRTRERPRPVVTPSGAEPPEPMPSEATPIAPAMAADAVKPGVSEPSALRRPTSKAKVQLDGENPRH